MSAFSKVVTLFVTQQQEEHNIIIKGDPGGGWQTNPVSRLSSVFFHFLSLVVNKRPTVLFLSSSCSNPEAVKYKQIII